MAALGSSTLDFQEADMARIVVKDLTENTELDRKAMREIAGGSRFRTQGPLPQQRLGQGIVNFKNRPTRVGMKPGK
jgi:hypothetical protein